MRHLTTIFCLLLSFLQSKDALAGWCGNSDAEDWNEFSTMYWAGPPGSSSRPVTYVLAAPWCPYCAQLFKMLGSPRLEFDARFVPVNPANDRHKDQVADMVMDGSDRSLARIYLNKSVDKSLFNIGQRDFINEVQEAVDVSLRARFEPQTKIWGTPMSFVMLGGKLTVIPGGLNIDAIDGRKAQLSGSPSPPPTRKFLEAMIETERPIEGRPVAKGPNTRLRVLPDQGAVAAFCLQHGEDPPVAPSGYITVEGRQWLVYKPYRSATPNRPTAHLRAYALGNEFEGWRIR